MIYFFIILIVIIFLIYLARNKIIEPLSPLVDSPYAQSIDDNVDIYLTNNYLNYDKINTDIDSITQQYNELKENIELFKMKVGYVRNLSQHTDSTIRIGGSFPAKIEINFEFPPPFPGGPGIKGDKGDNGDKGQIGPRGPIGFKGGNSYC